MGPHAYTKYSRPYQIRTSSSLASHARVNAGNESFVPEPPFPSLRAIAVWACLSGRSGVTADEFVQFILDFVLNSGGGNRLRPDVAKVRRAHTPSSSGSRALTLRRPGLEFLRVRRRRLLLHETPS